jgi:predicted Fe-Mo cluster-binding NifX family protein
MNEAESPAWQLLLDKSEASMIIAIPLFGSEVSPRFDCARQFLIVRVEGGRIVERNRIGMGETDPVKRVRSLLDRKVNRVICGGIDVFYTRILKGSGIQVIPWVSGDAGQALEKFAGESLSGPS